MRANVKLFDEDAPEFLSPAAGHILIGGKSGMGKTQLEIGIGRARLDDPRWGFQVIDPDGEISPALLEYQARPGALRRVVHHLRPASDYAFALPTLHVPDRSPQRCHEKAVRTATIIAQAAGFDEGEFGPRLTKFFYLGCYGLALTGRALVDLPELYSYGPGYLRRIISEALPYAFLGDEMRSLDVLSDRSFLEYRDPLISRLMPIFGNPQLRRVFGPQSPVDIARVLSSRECVLLDLGGLEHRDAVLIGKSYLSILYHEALRRPTPSGSWRNRRNDSQSAASRPEHRLQEVLRRTFESGCEDGEPGCGQILHHDLYRPAQGSP